MSGWSAAFGQVRWRIERFSRQPAYRGGRDRICHLQRTQRRGSTVAGNSERSTGSARTLLSIAWFHRSEGLSRELFASGEALWLGVEPQFPDEPRPPRVFLVSVPYALQAANAQTLGGLPPSAFVRAGPSSVQKSVVHEGKAAISSTQTIAAPTEMTTTSPRGTTTETGGTPGVTGVATSNISASRTPKDREPHRTFFMPTNFRVALRTPSTRALRPGV